MSSKLFAACLCLAVLGSIGCAGMYVPKDQYDRDITQLNDYKSALERDNAELRPKAEGYDRLKGQMDLTQDAGRFYGDIAASLKKALAGLGVDPDDVSVGDKGQIVFATDLLFDLGSWTISAKGKEVLAKFAQTQKGNLLKIVGHTDKKPIVTQKVKAALDTDTNLELSVKRAIIVASELMKAGISERAMGVEGKGSTESRPGGDAKCRRVEIFVVEGAHVVPTSAIKNAKPSKK
jgi:flagellar motor protein MotB